MGATTQHKVIRVHRQAMRMLDIVRRHLERFPQDGALFVIDFERALRDLGFDLSHGMREHLLKQLYSPIPDGGDLYEAVKQGRVTLPAQIRITFGPVPAGGKLTGADPNGPGVPLTRASLPEGAEEKSGADARAVPPKPGTGGYSVLVQLDDNIINRIISVAYDENLIPHSWNGVYQVEWPQLRMKIGAEYVVTVAKPTIGFDTIYVNGVALNLDATAKLRLTFLYLDFPAGAVPSLSDNLEVDIRISARAVGTAEIRNSGPDNAAVYLNLVDLKLIDVKIAPTTLPPLVQQLIQAAIERIVQTEVAPIVLPLSFDFERVRRAGVPIRVASRIRQPVGGTRGTLSIAVDTDPFGGDPSTIPHIIPDQCHFGFVTTRHFLVDQAWPIVRDQQFPMTQQGVQIHDPQLDLKDYYIYFFVKATKDITCLPSLNADVTLNLQFESFQDQKNGVGVYRTRLKVIYDDVDLSLFDKLFYSVLLFLILGPVGGVGVGLIGVVALNVVIAVLEGKAETDLSNTIQASSVGFRNKIPGTNIVVEASTPIAPTIYSDLIFGYGDAAFYPER